MITLFDRFKVNDLVLALDIISGLWYKDVKLLRIIGNFTALVHWPTSRISKTVLVIPTPERNRPEDWPILPNSLPDSLIPRIDTFTRSRKCTHRSDDAQPYSDTSVGYMRATRCRTEEVSFLHSLHLTMHI